MEINHSSKFNRGKRPAAVHWLFLLMALLLQSAAVILIKKASLSIGALSFFSVCTNPYYIAAMVCMLFQAIVWQFVLVRFPLMLAYYFMSGLYIVILWAGHFVFGEVVSLKNILGTVIIVVGICMLVQTKEEV